MTSARLRLHVFLAAASLQLAVPHAHAQRVAEGITLDDTRPSWALPDDPLPASTATDGTEVLARETEWHVEAASAMELVRRAFVTHTAASVADRSELEIPLAAGESLTLLGVRRTRGASTEQVLRPDLVRVIQPEARFEEGLYDESRRVLVLLEDVRPGDTIDYAYVRTVPMARYGGRFVLRAMLEGEPARRVRFVARWPAGRAIAARAHALERASMRLTTEPDGVRIEGEDLPFPELALDAPGWIDPVAWVELSEFASWAEVAAWAEPHFRTSSGSSIEGVPMESFRALPTEAERAQAALRFVEDDVRYLGIEVEERALVPSAPELVARRRYGDCKDKALLLVAILRALGIEATAALVDAERGRALDGDLPSPLAFDHAVVRARIDGADVWMDATRSYEREPIAGLAPLPFERALLVTRETTGLVEIPAPAPSQADSEIDEHYELGGRETLTVDALFRGREASGWRATIAGEGLDAVARALRESYAGMGLAPEDAEPMRSEEAEGGALAMHVRYTIHGFWNALERDVSAWSSVDTLPEPLRERPELPLAIPFPRFVVHRVRVDAESRWNIDPAAEHVASAAFDVTRSIAVQGRTLRIETHLRTLADHVEAADVQGYVRDRARANDALGFAVFIDTHDDRAVLPTSMWLSIAAAIVLVGIVLGGLGALGRWWRGRRRRSWRSATLPANGESPASAIEVADLQDAQRVARAMACCDATLEPRWSRVQLGGAAAFVQSATCPRCERTQRKYYRAAGIPATARPAATVDP